ASQPELLAWVERNPERARQLTPAEIDELLSLQGTGGPLTAFGVERFVELLERKRRLISQVHAIAGTEDMEMLEKLVGLIYGKVAALGGGGETAARGLARGIAHDPVRLPLRPAAPGEGGACRAAGGVPRLWEAPDRPGRPPGGPPGGHAPCGPGARAIGVHGGPASARAGPPGPARPARA